jgi:hypothetical protein
MKPETRKFERLYLRRRDQIERKGVRMAQAAISEQYRQFLSRAKDVSPGQWTQIRVSEQPVQNFFAKFYPMSADLAMMTRKHMMQSKSDDEAYLSVFETRMQHLVKTKNYASRITTITNTTQDRINTILSDVMTEAELGGYGIDKIRESLVSSIGSAIRGNVRARAQGIAQTEMISASNQASTYAADSTGLEYRKYWSTSHLQNIRPTHMACEQESIQKDGLRPDERFEANGLLYPGDPAGGAEEVCNCRCSILHEIV